MAERYQRRYGLHQAGNDGSEQMHTTIANQLGGFKSSVAAIGLQTAQRQGVAKAEQAAREYDLSKPPELSEKSNAAATHYNRLVTKSYQQSVQNRAHVRLVELKEQYKYDPASFNAATQKRRLELANESGELSGIALSAFDTVALGYEKEIRQGLMSEAVEVARTEEDIRISQAESIVLDYSGTADADEQTMNDLLAGFDNVVLGSDFKSPTEKTNALISVRHRATEKVYETELNDFLDAGEYGKAVKWIQGIAKRQVTDGKMSKVMAETGQTPAQLSESLFLKLKAHGEQVAEGIGQEDKQRTADEDARKIAAEEIEKTLADMGVDLTIDAVKAARPTLDADQYKEWLELADGKVPLKDSVAYNQLYGNIRLAVAGEDFDALADLEASAITLLRKAQITKSEYEALDNAVKQSRFAPGVNLFEGLTKTAEQMASFAATMSVVKAENDFNRWMKLNPEANPNEAEEMARVIAERHIPKGFLFEMGMNVGPDRDAQKDLLNKYLKKHNGNKEAVANDPDYLQAKIALDEQSQSTQTP